MATGSLAKGKHLETAIIDAANQIVLPTFVATLAIAIVWVPLFHLSGMSGWVFPPMAEAVIFAMLASFVLTYTLVPTLAKFILKTHDALHTPAHGGQPEAKRAPFFVRFQKRFQRRFDQVREGYQAQLEHVLAHRVRFVAVSLAMPALLTRYFCM